MFLEYRIKDRVFFTSSSHDEVKNLVNLSSGITVVYIDCQLNDRLGLIRKLGLSIHKTFSDVYLIERAYSKWGRECVNHLLGDFVFVIWDDKNKILYMCRDAVGIRLLYYRREPNRITFSNSIENILPKSRDSVGLDESFLAGYIIDKFFYDNEKSFFRSVKKVPAAHYLMFENNEFSSNRYWRPENVKDIRYRSDKDYSEALLTLYQEIIPDYLNHPGKIGVELSGGLDSSSIAVLVNRELLKQGRQPPNIYCWHPSPNKYLHHEGRYVYELINSVCSQEGLFPQYCSPSHDEIESYYKTNPFMFPSNGSLLFELGVQSQAKKQNTGVILSGWGGDQCVTSHGSVYLSELLFSGQLMGFNNTCLASGLSPPQVFVNSIANLIFPKRFVVLRKGKGTKNGYIQKSFLQNVNPMRHTLTYNYQSVKKNNAWQLTQPSLMERIETNTVHGQKNNILYRYPLLDKRLLEFSLGLPPEQYYRGTKRRLVARNAFNDILPKDVCWGDNKSDILLYNATMDKIEKVMPSVINQVREKLHPSHEKYINSTKLFNDIITTINKGSELRLGQIEHPLMVLNAFVLK